MALLGTRSGSPRESVFDLLVMSEQIKALMSDSHRNKCSDLHKAARRQRAPKERARSAFGALKLADIPSQSGQARMGREGKASRPFAYYSRVRKAIADKPIRRPIWCAQTTMASSLIRARQQVLSIELTIGLGEHLEVAVKLAQPKQSIMADWPAEQPASQPASLCSDCLAWPSSVRPKPIAFEPLAPSIDCHLTD